MKKSASAIMVLGIFAFFSHAEAQTVYAPHHTCAELQQLVSEQGPVGIQMRFGYAIYAPTMQACEGYRGGVGLGIVYGTRDAARCNVGYTCLENHSGNGN